LDDKYIELRQIRKGVSVMMMQPIDAIRSKVSALRSLPMPDFSVEYTKSAPEKSDKGYIEAIEEQAKRDAANGEFQSGVSFKALKKSYISVASPDRRGMVASLNRSRLSNRNLQSATLYDNTGFCVGSYNISYGWRMHPTPKEMAKSDSFHAIYNAAYFAAVDAMKSDGGLDVKA
jgi:hypothetical protein